MICVSDTYDEFLKELTPKQKELHDKFIDARESASCEELDNHYVEDDRYEFVFFRCHFH